MSEPAARSRSERARQLDHERAALVHAAVVCGDRWTPDPVLQAPQALVVALLDLSADRGELAGEQLVPHAS